MLSLIGTKRDLLKKGIRSHRGSALTFVFTVVFSLMACGTENANADEPHPHQGKITPITSTPPEPTLTSAEKAAIAKGDPVFSHVNIGGKETALAVFRVKASKNKIWKTIRNFSKYPEWIGNLDEITFYEPENRKPNDKNIYVQMRASAALFFSWNYYVRHDYPNPNDSRTWGSWRLDYSRKSEFDDIVGFWQVKPVEGQDNVCDVTYSVGVLMFTPPPDWIMDIITNGGISEATQWLKREAEAS